MENVQKSRATPRILRNNLNFGASAKTFKYALGTLLVLSSILGWRVLTPTPQVIQAAVVPPVPLEATGVSRHSTLSVEVFQKFVTQNSQRMYPRLSREIVQSAIKYSEKYDLSPILVLAVVATESQFYPFAISKKDAKGLMQINPEANQQLLLQEGIFQEPSDIFDPDRNIEAGCYLLRKFINESPDFNTALDKYLGADSISYKADIHAVMGRVLLLGITEELNKTAQHKIQPIVKVEAPPRARK
ncbi:MAG: transglycosylase SLT domain-containing protein [Acidobacteriia bacterium]|nr:transglycosylase SLT domain-containing protein [Terriglobia bacterium]